MQIQFRNESTMNIKISKSWKGDDQFVDMMSSSTHDDILIIVNSLKYNVGIDTNLVKDSQRKLAISSKFQETKNVGDFE